MAFHKRLKAFSDYYSIMCDKVRVCEYVSSIFLFLGSARLSRSIQTGFHIKTKHSFYFMQPILFVLNRPNW